MRPLVRIAVYVALASGSAASVWAGCSSDVESGSTGTSTINTGSGASSGTMSTSTETAAGGTSAGGAGSGATSTGGASTGSYTTGVGAAPPTSIATCQGHVYQCGDLVDNDGDGLVDSQDPDCLGPCDNTEDSYYGGIPGQNNAPCKMDCYFDQDTGAGNDDCYWNHECDPHEVAPSYDPEGSGCKYNPNANTPGTSATCDQLYNMQSQICMNYCGPLTPNGCDCFGCCELPAGGGNYVWLGSEVSGSGSCTIEVINDPTKCKPCLPVKACLNTCETCELCIGKSSLPPECFPDAGTTTATGAGGATSSSTTGSGGATGQCQAGVQPCGLPGESPCPTAYYCVTGCCQPVPP